jgi:hypothetical protein
MNELSTKKGKTLKPSIAHGWERVKEVGEAEI